MSVIHFEQVRSFRYADGVEFGDVGGYEQVDGVLTFAVDPDSPANSRIVDLKHAPGDAEGRVQFKADFSLLRPVSPERGSGTLIVELPNRGRKRVVDTFNITRADPSASPPPGDGFLFRRGYAVASIGWQWDVYRDDVLMGLLAPQANLSREQDPGKNVVEIRPNQRQSTRLLADRVHRPLRVTDVDTGDAVLYVREFEDGPESIVPRDLWRFARETDNGVQPSDEHIYLEGGFEPGKYYQVVYPTRDAPVAGAGLLAFRDVATFLRYDAAGLLPGTGEFRHVIGYGVSQTGRMIRHFLHTGLNRDEQGRVAYDGLLPHVAGARMGSFNHRYAQPSNQSYPNFGHMFPFSDSALADPLSGRTDGLLSKVDEDGSTPKIFYTNSSAEYWRGDCSLLTTDPRGKRDVSPAPSSRVYLFAGTQHGAAGLPQTSEGAAEGARGAQPFSVVDYSPLLRAALMNLVNWVADGIEPPRDCHPRIDDGSAASRADTLETFARIRGVAVPDPAKLWVIRTIDLGERAADGIGEYPPIEGETYACLVSAVDEDGNEVAGIRLPDIAHPVATHAGWNTRAGETGSPDQQIPMQGFSNWFPVSEEEREATGETRRSIEERYASREAYESLSRECARQLVADGYLLAEDLDLAVENALARYDYALSVSARQAQPATTG